MRWLLLATGIVLVVWGLVLGRIAPPEILRRVEADPLTLRETRRGPVIGGRAANGAFVWLGIPYARPPEGELRWRPPRPPEAWRGTRDALGFSSPCPQFASRLALSEAPDGSLIGAEDCLYLNVFAPPSTRAGAGLPVMVFIHGGGNSVGSATPYDASRLAREQGVIVVTLNYRLGILGWFRHAALRRDAATPEERSGNFALLDMIAALAWVRDEIGAFGGDPERVTLFGQSAGARNIFGLLAAPAASGLFHGAILQSGFPGTFPVELAEGGDAGPGRAHPNSSGLLLARWLGNATGGAGTSAYPETLPVAEQARFLRSLDLPGLFAGIERSGSMYRAPALFRDGHVLPQRPLPEVLADRGAWNRVPLLIGSNRDEMKLFLALSERHTRQRLGLIPAPRDPGRYERLARYHSEAWAASGVFAPLGAVHRGDPALPIFAYRFDWDAMRSNLLADLPVLLGAAHGLELDFLFTPLFAREVPGVLHAGNREDFAALGRSLRDYWAGFAHSGNPGAGRSATQPAWPAWTPRRSRLMIFDDEAGGGPHVADVSPLRVEALKAELAAEEGLPERLRCALYVDLFLENNGLPELFDTREYHALGCAPFPAGSLRGLSR